MKLPRILPLLLVGLAQAQVYTPPPQPAPAPVPQETAPAPASSGNSNPASPLGQEFPLLDASAETITIGGITIPLGDNRLLKARFEKYLSQPAEDGEEAEAYRATIKEILDTVSPFHAGGPDLYEAFKKLPTASVYPGDANICGSLAEAIYSSMLAKKDIQGLKNLNASIEAEKQHIISQADWASRHEKETMLRQVPAKAGEKQGSTTETQVVPGQGVASLKYADQLRRIAEIEAMKKANIARTETQTISTKAQYQVSMAQWFFQRRYEHVLMASRFYNQIWKDGDSALRINKNSDVAKLFTQSVGINPTVSSLDSLSNEAIREVESYVQAFELMLSRGELHSASKRLMEAFALGEFLPPVETLPLEKKQMVAGYVRDLDELYGSLQAHDFTRAKVLCASLKQQAKDFPSSKVDSVIAASTLASDLAIEEAKAQLMARDSDKAAEKIRQATEFWPTNPKLDDFRKLVGNSSALVMARNDFDRLLSEGNYREIANRQYEFAPAIQGDAQRQEAFKQIITNLTTIETALSKASEFSRVGQNYSAWEQLAKLRKDFPDDPKLGRELEILAPKVADFTKALDQAEQFENRTPKQTGSALSWYLKARGIYPQSDFAKAGIDRLLDQIMPGE
ncbi:hypothetical protein JIN85_05180 [Luteolibacter pohnpeiensis]|uniref:Uncharacterized protein n=1 Tax=Luteolibacter pohnpeiensis TaxID=454153 RepID=A0A934VV41_9BACT|nr:hypothetical protein [Luteolibacter pohnpeiensis]MBK1881795.1 hypothetical protein [Luteolibacter pohnpeiensis]